MDLDLDVLCVNLGKFIFIYGKKLVNVKFILGIENENMENFFKIKDVFELDIVLKVIKFKVKNWY